MAKRTVEIGDQVVVYGTTNWKSDPVRRVGVVTEIWPDGLLSLRALRGQPSLVDHKKTLDGEDDGYDLSIVHPKWCRPTKSATLKAGDTVIVLGRHNSVWARTPMTIIKKYDEPGTDCYLCRHPEYGNGAFYGEALRKVKS